MAKKHRFNLKVISNNGKVFLRLKGDLNGSGACQMEHALERLRHVPKTSRLTVDLSGIRDLDCFGVVHFAKAIRRQRYRFSKISLTGLKETTESLFKRFGLENGKVTHVQL
jgi:anti-anti-sigma factor